MSRFSPILYSHAPQPFPFQLSLFPSLCHQPWVIHLLLANVHTTCPIINIPAFQEQVPAEAFPIRHTTILRTLTIHIQPHLHGGLLLATSQPLLLHQPFQKLMHGHCHYPWIFRPLSSRYLGKEFLRPQTLQLQEALVSLSSLSLPPDLVPDPNT